MRIRATFAALALLAIGSSPSHAQAGARNPVEIGADAQIAFGLADQGTLSPSRAANQFHVRPVVGFRRLARSSDSAELSPSDTYTSIGVAGGLKLPLMDRVAARLEAEFRNQLEHDGQDAESILGLNFGLSFFTR